MSLSTRYQAGVRDRIVVGVANTLLKLASKQYRDLLTGVIRYGFASAAKDAGLLRGNPPFTEPLDDPQPVSESPGNSGEGLSKLERWMVDYEGEEGGPVETKLSWITGPDGDPTTKRPEVGDYLVRLRDVEALLPTQPVPGNSGGVEEGRIATFELVAQSVYAKDGDHFELCGNCGGIADTSLWQGFNYDEESERKVPYDGPNEPGFWRCPFCSFDHTDDDGNPGVWAGSLTDMVAERYRLLGEDDFDWKTLWQEAAASTQPPSPQAEVQDCERCGGQRRIIVEPGPGFDTKEPEFEPCPDCTGKQSPAEPQGDVVEAIARARHERLRPTYGAEEQWSRPWAEIAEPNRIGVVNALRQEPNLLEDIDAIRSVVHLEVKERLGSEATKEAVFQEAVKHMRFESPEHQEEYVWQLVDGVVATILAALDTPVPSEPEKGE